MTKEKPPSIRIPRQAAGMMMQNNYLSLLFDSVYQRTHGPYNPDYLPTRLMKIMRKDPQMALGLAAMKSPIIGANYEIVCRDADISSFAQQMFDDMRYGLVRHNLNGLDFGYQAFVFKWVLQKKFRYQYKKQRKDGTWEKTNRSKQNVYILKKMYDLDPEKVSWLRDPKNNQLIGILYDNKIKYNMEQVYIYSFWEEFNVKTGSSLMYNAYTPWFFRNICYLSSMRYLERKGDPPYKGYAPMEGTVTVTGTDDAITPMQHMSSQMINLRGGGNVIMPALFDEDTKQPLFDVEEITTEDRAELFISYINMWQVMMLRALLLPEQMLTQIQQTGSYAQTESHTKTASIVLNAIMNDMLESMNKYMMPRMTKYHFGDNAPKVTIKAHGISKESIALYQSIVEKVLQLQASKNYRGPLFNEMIDMTKLLENMNVPAQYQKLTLATAVVDNNGIQQVNNIKE